MGPRKPVKEWQHGVKGDSIPRWHGLRGENMEQDLLDILVISENQHRCCHLIKALEQLGCRCWFVSTAEEIRAHLDRHGFRLVLSTRPITEGSALMLLLCEAKRSVFYSIPVETGCLWFRAFPEIAAGERLFAVRPGAFKKLLTDLIASLQPPRRSISAISLRTATFNPALDAMRKDRRGRRENTASRSI